MDFSDGRNKALLAKLLQYKRDNPEVTLNFYECNLSRVNFNNTKLGDTSFQGSNLTGATFQNATIGSGGEYQFWKTNLTDADFTGAKIDGVQFNGTDFNNTILHGASIIDCSFGNPKNITSIEFNKSTTFKNSYISYHPEEEQTFKAAQIFFKKVPDESLRVFLEQ